MDINGLCIRPSLFKSKTVVYSGIHYFLFCTPKHRLWVEAVLKCTHNICFRAQIRGGGNLLISFIFTSVKIAIFCIYMRVNIVQYNK